MSRPDLALPLTRTIPMLPLTVRIAPALVLALATSAVAESTLERAAFQLSGACTADHRERLSSLSTMAGVQSIDFTSVPNHLLIDIDRQQLSAQDLAPIVRRLMAESECRVEPMESCISATPLSHHPNTVQSTDSQAPSH
jgi:hypothetical protein